MGLASRRRHTRYIGDWSSDVCSSDLRRAAEWIKENLGLRRHVVSALRRSGPLRMRDLEDRSSASWRSPGWTNDRNVSQMLHFLWFQGRSEERRVGKGCKCRDGAGKQKTAYEIHR